MEPNEHVHSLNKVILGYLDGSLQKPPGRVSIPAFCADVVQRPIVWASIAAYSSGIERRMGWKDRDLAGMC